MPKFAAASPFPYAAAGLCAILLSACASSGEKSRVEVAPAKAAYAKAERGGKPQLSSDLKSYGKGSRKYKDEVGVYSNKQIDPSGLDPIAAAAYWGSRFDRDNRDVDAAVNYSAALRKIGSVDEAVSVMTKASERNPRDPQIALETGRALIEAERAFEAVRYVENALEARKRDWRALSVYGVALDQIGEHELARQKYDAALLIEPTAVSVMSNKGLSFAMSGDLKSAVAVLRQAASNRAADARIRQNLALVLAIKGDLREAERLARSDLPPQVADQNVQYYRQLVNQPAYWQALAGDDVETPSFAPKSAPSSAPQTLTPPARKAPALEQPKETPKKKEKNAPIALQGAAAPTKASLEVPVPEIKAPKFEVAPSDSPAPAAPKKK